MQAGVAQDVLISHVLFSMCDNEIPILSHHLDLILYVDDTVIIATSHKPALLVCCLQSYLSDIERSLRERRIAINISKSTVMLFTRMRIQQHRLVCLFGRPILWVDTARCLGVTLDKRLT